MKILLIGANGQLGTDLHSQLQDAGHSVVAATRATLDICNSELTRSTIETIAPDLVINTAAFHNVELCETEAGQAFNVNAIAVRNLASLCAQNHCDLMHFSTDFVFGGESRQPYKETDLPENISSHSRWSAIILFAPAACTEQPEAVADTETSSRRF
jgi:dTDP-4-dehydrorhamnose reductase